MDPVRIFAAQFTPVDGGYLYYPSRRSGAKLVTAEEFQALAEAYRRRVGPWKIASVAMVAIVVWTFVSNGIEFPLWSKSVFFCSLIAAVCGWIFWAAYAPRRLVKDRPDIAPARSLKESKRSARAAIEWQLVVLVLLGSGAVFTFKAWSPDPTPSWWAWTVGSGLMFLAYAWIAFLKFRDRQP